MLSLTKRVKLCKPTRPIKEGVIVFIYDPNSPRNSSRRFLFMRLSIEAVGVVRNMKTSIGELKRAVSKFALLDLDDGEADRSTGMSVLRSALISST